MKRTENKRRRKTGALGDADLIDLVALLDAGACITTTFTADVYSYTLAVYILTPVPPAPSPFQSAVIWPRFLYPPNVEPFSPLQETNPISYYFLHFLCRCCCCCRAPFCFLSSMRTRVIVKAISIHYNSLCTGHYGVV